MSQEAIFEKVRSIVADQLLLERFLNAEGTARCNVGALSAGTVNEQIYYFRLIIFNPSADNSLLHLYNYFHAKA